MGKKAHSKVFFRATALDPSRRLPRETRNLRLLLLRPAPSRPAFSTPRDLSPPSPCPSPPGRNSTLVRLTRTRLSINTLKKKLNAQKTEIHWRQGRALGPPRPLLPRRQVLEAAHRVQEAFWASPDAAAAAGSVDQLEREGEVLEVSPPHPPTQPSPLGFFVSSSFFPFLSQMKNSVLSTPNHLHEN